MWCETLDVTPVTYYVVANNNCVSVSGRSRQRFAPEEKLRRRFV